MDLDQAQQSYLHDPMFHRVVDTIASWILDMNVTPAEARAAAMLACIRVEERRVRRSSHAMLGCRETPAEGKEP